ncbi:hypothetical protein GEMRC1_003125 [Eukaryota sp. GEM-RC1]
MTFLFYFPVVLTLVAALSLPGLDDLPALFVDETTHEFDVNVNRPFTKLKCHGSLISSIHPLPTTPLTSRDVDPLHPSLFSDGTHLFSPSSCTPSSCHLTEVSPLSAFSHLSFRYQHSDPDQLFHYFFNWDEDTASPKETFSFYGVDFPDTYLKATASLYLDFDFNVVQGISKVEVRLENELDSSLAVKSIDPKELKFLRELLNTKIASFVLQVGPVPIPIDFDLKVDIGVDIESLIELESSFSLTGSKSFVKLTYTPKGGLLVDYGFGEFNTALSNQIDGSVHVFTGLNVTLSVTLLRLITFEFAITPYVNGIFSSEGCPGSIHQIADFQLDLLAGMNNIEVEVLGKKFSYESRVKWHYPVVSNNLMSGCSTSSSVTQVASFVPNHSQSEYILQFSFTEKDGNDVERLYVQVGRDRTDWCDDYSGSTCLIQHQFFAPHNSQFSFIVYRATRVLFNRVIWRTKEYEGTVVIDGEEDIVIETDEFIITINPQVTTKVGLNSFVSTDFTDEFAKYFKISDVTQNLENTVFQSKMIVDGDDVDMSIYSAAGVSSDSGVDHGQFRNQYLPVFPSRAQSITVDCTKRHNSRDLRLRVNNVAVLEIEPDETTPVTIELFHQSNEELTIKLAEKRLGSDKDIVEFGVAPVVIYNTSRSGSTDDSSCTVSSQTFYPNLFLSLTPVSTPSSVVFVFSQDLAFDGCVNVMESGVYHFSSIKSDGFYHVTGKWFNVIDEDKISANSLIVRNPSTIVSAASQNTCVNYFDFRSYSESFSSKRVAFVIDVPRSSTSSIKIPSLMKGSYSLLNSDFWSSDIVFEDPEFDSEMIISNTRSTNLKYLVIFECVHDSCSGTIPLPEHSVTLISGSSHMVGSHHKTDFQLSSDCHQCRVDYEKRSDVNVDVTIGDDTESLSSYGYFNVPECRFSLSASSSSDYMSLTSSCLYTTADEMHLPPMGKVLVDNSVSLSSNEWFIALFADSCENCKLERSPYIGDFSRMFVGSETELIEVSSVGDSANAKLLLVSLADTECNVTCKIVGAKSLNCSVGWPFVFLPGLFDVDFADENVRIVDKDGESHHLGIEEIQFDSPISIKISAKNDVFEGRLRFGGSLLGVEQVDSQSFTLPEEADATFFERFWYIAVILIVLVLIAAIVVIVLKKRKPPKETQVFQMPNLRAVPV